MILKDSVRERSLCPPCQPAGRMTPPCSDSRKLLPHFRIESLRSKVMVKVFCRNLTHRWLCFLRHLSRRKQDISASTRGGALVILKDSVRERSLCPPCQPAGRMTPPCSDSRKLLPHFRIESLRSKVMVKVFCQKSDAPLALPAAPEPQEAGDIGVNERGCSGDS